MLIICIVIDYNVGNVTHRIMMCFIVTSQSEMTDPRYDAHVTSQRMFSPKRSSDGVAYFDGRPIYLTYFLNVKTLKITSS